MGSKVDDEVIGNNLMAVILPEEISLYACDFSFGVWKAETEIKNQINSQTLALVLSSIDRVHPGKRMCKTLPLPYHL